VSTTFRASDQPRAARRDWWQHVVSRAMGSVEVRIRGALDDRDQLMVGDVGALRVGVLSAGEPGGASRTARHIRQWDPDLCKIDILERGSGVVEQDGRQARLRPGDFTLVDLSRPARWTMSSGRMVAVVFPRPLLPLRHQEVAWLTAVGIRGDKGAAALASSLALELPGQLDDDGLQDGARLGTAVLDLLTVALATRLDGARVSPDVERRALVRRIDAFIERHLHDPGLSPGTIAAAHHISLRYLHKLFESQQTTVADRIRRRRLERCRRDLLDPALWARPVSAIAMRWGLTNPAHFSRAFRAAYGVPPAEYRRMTAVRIP
jgi:AraC-like DNA-binding protein